MPSHTYFSLGVCLALAAAQWTDPVEQLPCFFFEEFPLQPVPPVFNPPLNTTNLWMCLNPTIYLRGASMNAPINTSADITEYIFNFKAKNMPISCGFNSDISIEEVIISDSEFRGAGWVVFIALVFLNLVVGGSLLSTSHFLFSHLATVRRRPFPGTEFVFCVSCGAQCSSRGRYCFRCGAVLTNPALPPKS
eukprot:TRINITY_DN7697_c0_g1_i1.p1 TRINITY_DN7697_c0_g1~~TRINITY_DN7697_c0_g1_i1.p1  ORF type:complete len:192 (-),score=34.41 TRINITY_DN7697_c0_g1_i1:39-614(-)